MSGPSRPPSIQPTGIFEGLKPGAIVFGVFVDTLASILASLLLIGLLSGPPPSGEGGPAGPAPADAARELASTPRYLFASLAVGLACTVLGAFAGARRAACFFVRHGVWVGIGSALVGLLFYGSSGQAEPRPPLWFDMLGFSLLLPAGALGGYLARLAARRSEP